MKTSNRVRAIAMLTIFMIVINAFAGITNSFAVITKNLPRSEIKYDANDNSSVFPDSYKQYIKDLKAKHPNWIFKAVYTNLDWTESVRQESYEIKEGISTIHDSYSSNWKRDGQNYYSDGSYVQASTKAIAYTMDPRNFLYESTIFQFEALDYNDEINYSTAVTKILSGTTMETYSNQYKKAGNMVNLEDGLNWTDLIIKAAKESGGTGISATHLASRMKQETSLDIMNNGSINGSNSKYTSIYNFFNIGASPSYEGASDSVENGLKYAKSQGWTTPYASILAGAKELREGYIQYGQNTIYFEKFDVTNPYGNAKALYKYQYMTNIVAPINESKITYKSYLNSGMLNSDFVFYIPVYDNMPSTASPHPDSETTESTILGTDLIYMDDDEVNGIDTFNVRSGPSTDYEVIGQIVEKNEGATNRTKYTRTQIGTNGWDRIIFKDGTEGYVYQAFVRQFNYTHVSSISLDKTSVTLKKGETTTITPTILPSDAYIKTVSYESSNTSVATVDSNGKITATGVGTAVITAKTLDQGKTATCNVTVEKTLATSISVDRSEYSVVVDKYIQIEPKIEPSTVTDTSYTIAIADTSIATIENGKIKGVKEGTTKVTYKTKDGSNKTCEYTLKVTKSVATIENLNIDSSGNITNINPKTKAADVIKNITTSFTIKLVNISGNEITSNDNVGTGTKIQILSGSTILQEYNIIVYGDVNGDSEIKANDYVLIKNYIMNTGTLSNTQKMGADYNKDSKVSSSDYVRIKNYIMGN